MMDSMVGVVGVVAVVGMEDVCGRIIRLRIESRMIVITAR